MLYDYLIVSILPRAMHSLTPDYIAKLRFATQQLATPWSHSEQEVAGHRDTLGLNRALVCSIYPHPKSKLSKYHCQKYPSKENFQNK